MNQDPLGVQARKLQSKAGLDVSSFIFKTTARANYTSHQNVCVLKASTCPTVVSRCLI